MLGTFFPILEHCSWEVMKEEPWQIHTNSFIKAVTKKGSDLNCEGPEMVLPCLPPFLTFCPYFFDFMKFKSLRRDVIQQVKKGTARGHSGDFIPCPRPDRFDETGRCNQLLGSVRCVCRVRFNEVSYQSLTGVCSIDPLLLHLQTKFLAAFGRQLVWTAKSWFSLPALDFIAVAVLGALLRLQCQRHQLWTILNAHSANVSLLLYSSRQGPAKLTLLIGHCTNFEQCLPCFHLKKRSTINAAKKETW